ncbi:MCE family protein [Mycobacterium sp. CVI_P3]|uniref:MCE family protein n=1 Tax=Mycobacterium pinniadriaticum TaxID=2994102 RepID=A0ABT3SGV2_9MYCO|nr:MCE family protein [Mycobacterium pinniadriaticum]MCX2932409.1 MCE family protein [Mycobacterium pinniadriaticum]MCX2938734.1 MCE family protein [Mycobacterium pinniadriaticum]
MKDNLRGVIWRIALFMAACALGTFALLAVFAQLRFQEGKTYRAEFANVSGLAEGNFVRIAGVEVGKVEHISIKDNNVAIVEFSADDSVLLTQGTRAAIRYENLIGGRYLALEEGTGGVGRIDPGQTIPLSQTEPALDLDALIGGFRPLFRALDPDQVNALSGQLIQAFQGQGATIGSFLSQVSSLTNTLADRDQLIGEVITNLNVVLGSLGDQSDQFGKGVTAISELVKVLAERKTDISTGVAYANEAAGTFADLLSQARPPLQKVVHETDRAAAIAVADADYLNHLLDDLPEKYRILNRQGLFGDFFSFYICDVVLKVNGKGGQPVYVKVAGQSTGRCTPK